MSKGLSPFCDLDPIWPESSGSNRIRIHNMGYGIKIQMLLCAGFKPNMYRLMQTTGKTLEMAVNFTKLFHAKRNRQQFFVFPSQIGISASSSLLNLSGHQFKCYQSPVFVFEVQFNFCTTQFSLLLTFLTYFF
jgi:hypothetical protein